MKKMTVLVVGILAVAALCAFALHKGHDGAIYMIANSAIGLMVGLGFRMKPDRPKSSQKQLFPILFLVAVLALSGCASGGGPSVMIEACYVHETYGQVCAILTRKPDGKFDIYIKTNLPPDILKDVESWIRKKETGGS